MSIPRDILSSKLGSGGRGRGLRRGRGGQQQNVDPDKIIQGTDNDALGSRLSAVNAGYLSDPYIKYFHAVGEYPTRYPIINRGTYARTIAIDRLVTDFLKTQPDVSKQIVSLGAGKDTRYFRLASEFPSMKFGYHEIDYQAITHEKVQIIKRTPALLSSVANHAGSADAIHMIDGGQFLSPTYNLHPIDLRTIDPFKLPVIPNLDPELPTLILSECCLCYIPYNFQSQIITSFAQHYTFPSTPLGIVIYEPIQPNDSFGRVMISNLSSRGITMQTIQKFENLAAQRSRLQVSGFSEIQCAADIRFIYETWIDKAEQDRVARCEMLDEIEEWVLLARHYCITWGARDIENSVFGPAWSSIPTQSED